MSEDDAQPLHRGSGGSPIAAVHRPSPARGADGPDPCTGQFDRSADEKILTEAG